MPNPESVAALDEPRYGRPTFEQGGDTASADFFYNAPPMQLRAALVCVSLLASACGSKPSHTSQPTTSGTSATDKILVNVDERGVGLGGNDPMSYRTDVAAGTEQHASQFGGATYQFASAENKTAFDGAPSVNAPAYGGYCAFAASQNRLSPSDPSVFLVHEGQLLVFTNEDFRAQFQKDAAGNKAKADANWPGLVAKHGK